MLNLPICFWMGQHWIYNIDIWTGTVETVPYGPPFYCIVDNSTALIVGKEYQTVESQVNVSENFETWFAYGFVFNCLLVVGLTLGNIAACV